MSNHLLSFAFFPYKATKKANDKIQLNCFLLEKEPMRLCQKIKLSLMILSPNIISSYVLGTSVFFPSQKKSLKYHLSPPFRGPGGLVRLLISNLLFIQKQAVVRLNHHLNKFFKSRLRLPAENFFRLRCIAKQ
jgi:hypothetical protein